MYRNAKPFELRRALLGGPLLLGSLSVLLVGCGGSDGEVTEELDASVEQEEAVALGPTDGFDLPPTEIDRVSVGMEAPDFSLASIAGETLTLSALRGAKNVILVFYRGHW